MKVVFSESAAPLNVSYALRRSAPQEMIALEASAAGDVQHVFWFDGSAFIGVRPLAEGAFLATPCVGYAPDSNRR
jgi:hypothetical protein